MLGACAPAPVPQQKVNIVVSALSSVNSSQAVLAQAQQKVQDAQTQVQQDNARLAQSQAKLSRNQEQLSQAQQDSRQVQQPAIAAAPAVRLDSAITTAVTPQTPLPAALAGGGAQINAQGQTIGGLINVQA